MAGHLKKEMKGEKGLRGLQGREKMNKVRATGGLASCTVGGQH
jgi:hypothetical protein